MSGAGLGLVVAHLALQRFEVFLKGRDMVGFWVDYGLQPQSAAYALGLALLAAVMVGVVPGLKSTGRKLDAHHRRMNAGASVRLGWMRTVLIVLQVAMAITVLPAAVGFGVREITRMGQRATYPANEFLSAEIGLALPLRPGMDREQYRRESAAKFADRLPELERRLEAEPAVAGVTLEGRLRGRDDLVEVEGVPGPAVSGTHRIDSSGVAPDYFEVLGVRLLAGDSFRLSETGEMGTSLVVSEAFVRQILGEGPAPPRDRHPQSARRPRTSPPRDHLFARRLATRARGSPWLTGRWCAPGQRTDGAGRGDLAGWNRFADAGSGSGCGGGSSAAGARYPADRGAEGGIASGTRVRRRIESFQIGSGADRFVGARRPGVSRGDGDQAAMT